MDIPTLDYEQTYWQQGLTLVAGLDEVGRGCWAGPVVAAAVVLPVDVELSILVRDSKQLSSQQRLVASDEIRTKADCLALGQAEVDEINHLAIGPATTLAMQRAIAQLDRMPQQLLIDGLPGAAAFDLPATHVVKGDAVVASIAAASIVAKVYRDQMMDELDHMYPNYGLALHKGYGTKLHQQAILNLGLSPIHRQFRLKFLS